MRDREKKNITFAWERKSKNAHTERKQERKKPLVCPKGFVSSLFSTDVNRNKYNNNNSNNNNNNNNNNKK